MSTTIHPHLDIAGLSTWTDRDIRRLKGVFRQGDRVANTVPEIRAVFAELLSDGQRCLAMGEPCEGFSPLTGCPGHEPP